MSSGRRARQPSSARKSSHRPDTPAPLQSPDGFKSAPSGRSSGTRSGRRAQVGAVAARLASTLAAHCRERISSIRFVDQVMLYGERDTLFGRPTKLVWLHAPPATWPRSVRLLAL